MRHAIWAPLFVAVAAGSGWGWQVAHARQAPDYLTIPGVMISAALLAVWLRRRLDQAYDDGVHRVMGDCGRRGHSSD